MSVTKAVESNIRLYHNFVVVVSVLKITADANKKSKTMFRKAISIYKQIL